MSETVRLLLPFVLLLTLAAPADARVPRDWLGVMVDGPMVDSERPAEWDRLDASGAGSVRASFYWDQLEPSPGSFDWTASDRVVAAAAERGLKVLPVVLHAPGWARDGDVSTPPRDPADYARFLEVLVRRYGPAGTFWAERPHVRRVPVRDWQVWNEPSMTRYWDVQPFAASYVALLRPAAAAIRSADPGARVILAGLPNESWTALRSIYAAGGRGHFDAVALHPYTSSPRNVLKLVRYARKEMRRAGDGRRRVWITELSWPAAVGRVPGRKGFLTTERGMARRIREAIPLLARKRRKLRIQRVLWYTWLSSDSGPNAFAYAGLRRVRGDRVVSVPALKAFRRVAKRLR